MSVPSQSLQFAETAFATPADDPAIVTDWQQVRQSFFDPNQGPLPNPEAPATPPATPAWPLFIVLGIVGYALFWGGKHS